MISTTYDIYSLVCHIFVYTIYQKRLRVKYSYRYTIKLSYIIIRNFDMNKIGEITLKLSLNTIFCTMRDHQTHDGDICTIVHQ